VRVNSVLLAVLALIAGPAAQSAPASGTTQPSAVKVSPRTGTAKTHFVVSFSSSARTGSLGVVASHDVLVASGPAAGRGCLHTIDAQIPDSGAGAKVRVVLDPARIGGKWCTGTYRGQVEELQGPECPVGRACPAFVLFRGTIGRFSFQVKRPAPKPKHG